MNHSELPWIQLKGKIFDKNGSEVAEATWTDDDSKFIVKACNNYEQLKELCKELVGELEYLVVNHREETKELGFTDVYLNIIDNLIAKSKEIIT